MSLNTKLAALKQKSVELTVKEVKLPENAADPLALFESNSSAKAATANEWTIDVFPSQIPISTFLMKLAATASTSADHKDNSKSSLATFCMYYMCVFQGFLLLNDLHVRTSPSAHAASWSTVSYKAAFAQWLLSLPVPDSMVIIFEQLAAATSDKTMNIFYIPSAAGFNLHHFFGRFIPVNFFAHIHDCVASMPGNSRPADIYKDLFPRTLFSYTDATSPDKTSVVIADLLGITVNTTTASHAAHKWYQTFSGIFNPVLFRDFHRRSSLATLDLESPVFTSMDKTNAYDILFSATPHSLRELKTVLQHVAGILQSTVPMKHTLSSMMSNLSGTNILHHGYSEYALPTWTANPDTVTASLDNITRLTSVTTTARATDFKYLVNPTSHTGTETITAATAQSSGTTDTASISSLTFPWSLVASGTATTPLPVSNRDFILYDDEIHAYPRVLVLDTVGKLTVTAHLATLTGKTIETLEIDGTTIPLPHPTRSLAMQNCVFADSAVPYKHVIRATKFHSRTTPIMPVLKRSSPRASNSLPASSLLHDRTMIRLPKISGNGDVGSSDIMDTATFTTLPGMTEYGATNWLRYAQSFFGFHTKIRANAETVDTVPATEIGRLFVWSPYTYTSQEDSSPEEILPNLSENRTYFLTNLRTIFGTDLNLVEVTHPMEAMPV
jgi:hypothetical protein